MHTSIPPKYKTLTLTENPSYPNYSQPPNSISSSYSLAKNLIQSRLNKLQHQKELLSNHQTNQLPYSKPPFLSYNSSHSLTQAGTQIANPYPYYTSPINPLYYPFDMPRNAEPINPPRMDLGTPVFPLGNTDNENDNNNIGDSGISLTEFITLVEAIGKIKGLNKDNETPYKQKRFKHLRKMDMDDEDNEEITNEEEENISQEESIKSKKEPIIQTEPMISKKPTFKTTKQETGFKIKKQETKKKKKHISIKTLSSSYSDNIIDDIPKTTLKRNWWKLARSFIHLYVFYSFAHKYSRRARLRSKLIARNTKEISNDIALIKQWVSILVRPFLDEFAIIKDLNLSFRNIDSENKIIEKTHFIIIIIKKYMENLISKSSKLKDIPVTIQKILYKYIKDKAYYAKQYLSAFQINRLNFDVYGATTKLNDKQGGMLLAFFVICGVTVQQILLHIKEVEAQLKDFPSVTITAKYVGSIMHYLTRDAFQLNCEMRKEVIALLNYYRNYHLLNVQLEHQRDAFKHNMQFIDDGDEFAKYLIPEDTISKFWEYNAPFVKTYKSFIFTWACKLAKEIRKKYKVTDKDLKEEDPIERPKDKRIR